jgi:endonuclease-3
MEVRIHGDDVDLAHRWVHGAVDLGPARAGQTSPGLEHDEAVGVEPGLPFPFHQRVQCPMTLFGMAGEGPVVGGEPGLLVQAGPERPELGRRSGEQRGLQRGKGQRTAHLEQLPLQDETVGRGPGVVCRIGQRRPQAEEAAAPIGDYLLDRVEQDVGDIDWRRARTDVHRCLRNHQLHGELGSAVPRQVRVPEQRPVRIRRPRHQAHGPGRTVGRPVHTGRMGPTVELVPLVLAQRHVTEHGRHAVDQVDHRRRCRRCRIGHHLDQEVVHPLERTGILAAMARPRTSAGRARTTNARLAVEYPGSAAELCALDHDGPFQLLAATILSAQCTDARVNLTTPSLFARYPDAAALASADLADVEAIIRSTGFFRAKARNLVGMAAGVEARFGGEVPTRIEDLVTLPGVGRKTANVVRSVAFDLPGLPVDTHVQRLSRRLALTDQSDPVKVETALNAMIPAGERGAFSLRLILHGRSTCTARSPKCPVCILADFCPSAGMAPGRS